MTLSKITLANLAAMPDRLTDAFQLVPERYQTWIPLTWDGIPGERFSLLGQICHVRDIEVYGYHVRVARMLAEEDPALVSLDSYRLAIERNYETADPEEALAVFRVARGFTVDILKGVTAEQLERRGTFGEYGPITLRSLVHYLSSHDLQHLACIEWLLGQIHARREGARA